MNDAVSELTVLLGKPVVFINWPRGVKGSHRKWKHLRDEDMTPEYLAKLPKGNIGVALGEVSGGLCAIDFDEDRLVQPFLDRNPNLIGTLQTHGARGRVFWVRFNGDYPKRTTKLKTPSGEVVGEFRSNGGQSIVWGIHPDTQQPYQFVVRQGVVEGEFNSIVWPAEISNQPALAGSTEETEEQKNRSTDVSEVLKSCCKPRSRNFYSSISTVEDAVRVSMPSKKRENNACLFKLARAVKTLEVKGQTFDLPKLEVVFDRWYTQAHKFLREDQTKEDYYLEFMNACQRAKFPLGGAMVAEAWGKATSQPLPPEAKKWTNPKLQLLVALLKQMQAMKGAGPFFITLRDCAALLGCNSHTTVDTWMGALAKLSYIRVAEPGNERRATRYRYVWKQVDSQRPDGLTAETFGASSQLPALSAS